MSALPLLPEEVLYHICSFATSTDSCIASADSEKHSNYAFGLTSAQHNNRALGLATRRALNGTSRLFRSVMKEFLFEDITLKSTDSAYEFANFLASVDVAWWVRRLKIKFPSQWHGSTHRPVHAEGVARIISLCPRLLAFEDALESGAGGTAPAVFAALAAKPSLRAIGWTGEAYPSTTDVRNLLDSLPELETLHLEGCNPVRNGRSLPAPATPTSIQVPALRSVTLRLPEMRSADIFPILINAMIPSFTTLTLVGNFYFGGNLAAKHASLREFFDLHGPRLLSLDMRDDGQFTPVGPLVEFLAKCNNLKEIAYPIAWTPPLCPMPKVETVGLRTVVQELEVSQTALKCIGAHFEVLLSDAFPKLKTIRLLDDGMLHGYPDLKDLAPHVREYLAVLSQRCSAKGIAVTDSMGMLVAF